MALDASGNLYIADTSNYRVREVNAATKFISTFAGNGMYDSSGDGGGALGASFFAPSGISVDSAGDVFICDGGEVREVNASTHIINRFAGGGYFFSDGGPASNAFVSFASGTAIDAAGNVYIADAGDARVRVVNHATQIITTYAGNGIFNYGGDGGPATSAGLFDPMATAVDAAGDVFIVDTPNNVVREMVHATGQMVTVAGSGVLGYSGDGGSATAAKLQFVTGIAVDASGNLYIADTNNNRIREVNHSTGIITTIAGGPIEDFGGDGGPASSAYIDGPEEIAIDPAGNIFFYDSANGRIREINHATNIITTVAGGAGQGFSGDGGLATNASLFAPGGLAVDAADDIFIADTQNQRVREVNGATHIISTIAGNGNTGFSGDGPATSVSLDLPGGVAVDGAGNVFIADTYDNRIRELNHNTGVLTTIAGSSASSYSGDGGPAGSATFNLAAAGEPTTPQGIAVDSAGNVYVSDRFNSRVREISGLQVTVTGPLVAVTGASQPIADGAATTSTANATAFGSANVGATLSVTYTITNSGIAPLSLGNVSIGGTDPSDFSVTGQPASSVAAGGSTSFTIQFQPTALGTRPATVKFTENDPSQPSPFIFAVSGIGLAPQIAVTGNSQAIADGASTTSATNDTTFGSTPLGGASLSETYTITNSGTAPLTVGTVTIGGTNSGDFTVTSPPAASVAVGGSTTFTVQFTPTAGGTRNATVNFAENDPTAASPFTFAVSGVATTTAHIGVTGNSQAIADGASTTSATNDTAFGSTPLGGASLSETYTITNSGTAPLTVGTVTIGGTNSGDFTVTSPPAGSVAVGGSTTFTVQFTPTAGGTRTATVNFAENDPTAASPFTFAVSGVATTTAHIGVTGNSQAIADGASTTSATNDTAFGSTPLGGASLSETYTITNSGTAPLTVGTVTIGGTNSGDFTVTSPPAGSVAVGGSTTFTIRFTPTAGGTRTATVGFAENDPTAPSPFTFAISGIATTTAHIGVTGNSQAIADGASTTSATNDTAFGSTPLGGASLSETYTITNSGTAPLTVGTVTIGGTNSGDFTVTSPPAGSVAVGGSTTFTVQFTPTAGGTRTATVSFAENDPSAASPFTFAISGIATTTSHIGVTGNSQPIADGATTTSAANDTNFGSAIVGSTPMITETYTISNSGAGNLTLGTVTIGGTNSLDFSIATQPASTVAAGGNTTFTVQWLPEAVGARSATVNFTDNDNSQASPFTFAIGGVATPQPYSATGLGQPIANYAFTASATNGTNFGTIAPSGQVSETYTVINSGSSPLTLGNVIITGANPNDFTVTSEPATSVAAGSSTTFTVQFSPTATGVRNALVIFFGTESAQESEFAFSIAGTDSLGTWQTLTNSVPGGQGIQLPILLSDGTVMSQLGVNNASRTWDRLTPDSTGSYANGTWSALASSNQYRLFAPSVVLPDGRVFWVGGEYSGSGTTASDTNSAEIYNPLTNVWTTVASFPQSNFGDDPLEVLPNGTVLAGYLLGAQTYIYNPATNVWSQTGTKLYGDRSDEETWIKLPDGSILSYDVFTTSGGKGQAQRYIPSTGQWVDASGGNLPILTSSTYGYELGPGMLLPDGRVFLLGANGLTAFYNPSTNLWSQGPTLPTYNGQQLGADDDPAAMLPGGDVLLAVSPVETNDNFVAPTRIYDFNPTTNVYTDVTPNDPTLSFNNAFIAEMLVLPSGQVMLTNEAGGVDIYTPFSGPQNSWRPAITSLVNNGNATFTLTGTQLNGLSEGSSFGDDWSNASNYPIVQLTSAGGAIYYARTSNWSSTGVATGSLSETVQFTVPSGVPYGTYSVTAIANGIPSTTPQSILVGPAIAVTGSGQAIADGAATTSSANATAFGSTAVGATILQTFTITNSGTAALSVGSVSITGANPGDFTVIAQPATSVPVGGSTTFTVQFDPPTPGSRVATVNFTENDASQTSPFTFAIGGVGLQPSIAVAGGGQAIADGATTTSTANGTDFGSMTLAGSPLSETYTVTNNGNAPLNLGTVTLSGTSAADFLVTGQPSTTVAPGTSTTFTVQFNALGTGTRSAIVSFTQTDPTQASPFTFAISGVGNGPLIAMTGNGYPIADGATTTSATNNTAFGNVTVSSSTLQIFQIVNSGNQTLNLGTIGFGGADPGDFFLWSTPGTTIAPGTASFFAIAFQPVLGGTRTATVSFTDSDPTQPSPFTFAISGGGLAPTIGVTGLGQPIADGAATISTADATDFGDPLVGSPIAETYTITNSGTAPLTLGSASISGGNAVDFSVVQQPASSVAAGSSTSFTVQFTPSAAGNETTTVSFSENDPAQMNPFDFTIGGQGIGTPTVTVSDAGGPYTGNPYPATALVNGAATLEGIAPTLAYYVGSAATGTPSSTAPTAAGTYTVVANFGGSPDYAVASSAPLTFTIYPVPTSATVGIPLGVLGNAGQTVNLPVGITDNAFGVASADLVFDYNPDLLTLTNSNVSLSNYLTGVGGWSLAVNVNNAQGVAFISIFSTTGLPAGTPQLLNLAFTVASDAPFGSTPITIDPSNSDVNNSDGAALTLSISNGSVAVKATPSVTVTDAGGTYTGNPFPATALVNGQASLEGASPTLAYYVGSTATGTPSSTPPSAVGTYTVVATFPGSPDYLAASSNPVTFSIVPFAVTSFAQNSTGFAIGLNAAPNLSVLNLYSGSGSASLGAPDLTLLNGSTPVQGSLVWDPSTLTATFVQTRGILAPGNYSVTLVSGTSAWVDNYGNPLNGGSNYTNTFTVAAPAAPILTLPDFARGPGQAVNVDDAPTGYGTALTTSLPVALSNTTGVTSVSFELDYNASYLNISNVALAAGISGTLSFTNTTPGVLLVGITGFSSTATAGAIGGTDIVDITASVPAAAISTYGASALLAVVNPLVNGAAVATSDAVEKVAYFGDANGDGKLGGADASLVARNKVHLDSGFNAYPLTDPRLVADIAGTGNFTSLDASQIAQAAVHLPVANIPTIPSHGAITLASADPTVGIPSGIAATAGQMVDVPVSILDNAAGLASADLAIDYNPAILSLTAADITLSSTLSGLGWSLATNVMNADGVAYVSISSIRGLPAGTPQLLNLAFSVADHAPSGSTAIAIDPTQSGLGDASGDPLTLSTSSGSVVITGVPRTPGIALGPWAVGLTTATSGVHSTAGGTTTSTTSSELISGSNDTPSVRSANIAAPVAALPVGNSLAMGVSLAASPRPAVLGGTAAASLAVVGPSDGLVSDSAVNSGLNQAAVDWLLTGSRRKSSASTQSDAVDSVLSEPLFEW